MAANTSIYELTIEKSDNDVIDYQALIDRLL
jgi:hypothetical protein